VLKAAVFLAAIPALVVVAAIVLALAVVVVPGLLLVRRLDRPQADPPYQAGQESVPPRPCGKMVRWPTATAPRAAGQSRSCATLQSSESTGDLSGRRGTRPRSDRGGPLSRSELPWLRQKRWPAAPRSTVGVIVQRSECAYVATGTLAGKPRDLLPHRFR
jgi:hypothetical protein